MSEENDLQGAEYQALLQHGLELVREEYMKIDGVSAVDITPFHNFGYVIQVLLRDESDREHVRNLIPKSQRLSLGEGREDVLLEVDIINLGQVPVYGAN